MEIFDIRLTNLRQLISERDGPAAFARLINHGKSYVSALAGPNPSRKITETTAREIEKKAGKPAGWLDAEHTTVDKVDGELLTVVMARSRDAANKAKLKLSSMQYAVLALLV